MLWFILFATVIVLVISQAEKSKTRKGGGQVGSGSYRVVIEQGYREPEPVRTDLDHIRASRSAWVPPGASVEVAGFEVRSGLVYVARAMPAIDQWSPVDPALIDPSLPVSKGGAQRGLGDIGYWPSYSEIDPGSRRAYLAWLASGRRDPGVPLGYVFLFFYGLERRVLFDLVHDNAVRDELPSIEGELEGLLAIYGDQGSFATYGSGLLGIVRYHSGTLTSLTTDPPQVNPHWALPTEVSVSIGEFVKRGEPIPPEWAHSWAVCSPAIGLRTPAKRCPREFKALFEIRYREKYGTGLKIKEPKTRLHLEYRPASRGLLHRPQGVDLDLPDVGALSGPQKKLQALVDQTQSELDRFSRHVGRHDDRTSVAAQALLPAALVGMSENEGTAAMRELLERSITDGDEIGRVRVEDLVALFPTKKPGTLRKNEARTLCDLVGKLGFGIEPDTARGGQNLGKSEFASVYRVPAGDLGEVAWSDAATLLLRVGSAVAASDDSITEEEERALEAQLEKVLSLNDVQRLRFRAHLRWSLTHPVSLRGVRKKTEGISEWEREKIAHAVLAIAFADGQIDPDEMTSLVKIYDLLGFAEEKLYKELHEGALDARDVGPVTVASEDESPEFRIPARDEKPTKAAAPKPIRLDPARIKRIAEDSKVASNILAGVFEEQEAADATSSAITGLDGPHSTVFQQIIARSHWTEEELSALIETHGLFVSGAIEVLNEAAFEKCGEPLIESGEGWEVNEFAIEEMTS